MNQRGEIILSTSLLMMITTFILMLFGLRLHYQWLQVEQRSKNYLCAKEFKEETIILVEKIEMINILIRNTDLAESVAIFIPPLWPYVGNSKKIKTAAKSIQATMLLSFLNKTRIMKSKACPIKINDLAGPYRLGGDFGFKRDQFEQAELKERQWEIIIGKKRSQLSLKFNLKRNLEWPKLISQSSEKMAKSL